MMIKRLNKASFWILLLGLIAYFVPGFFWCILLIVILPSIDFAEVFAELEGIYSEEQINQMMEVMDKAVNVLIVFFVVNIIVSALLMFYFIRRLVKNKKQPQGQTYITVLMVFAIIIGVLGLLILFRGIPLMLVLLLILGAIIVGCVIQKKYIEPAYIDPITGETFAVPPYGNPYGNPYGVPPGGNPYGNPYGVPPNNDPNQPPSNNTDNNNNN